MTAEEPPTITNEEICRRLHIQSQETLHRWEKSRGLTPQFRTGKKGVRNRQAYFVWEKENYPELYPDPPRPADEDTIDLMRQGAKLTSDFVIRVEKVKRPKPRKKK